MKGRNKRKQRFGDLNRQLSNKRRQWNAEIREAAIERINKKREVEIKQDESLIEPSDLNKETA